jgi:glutathione peroxidase
MNNHKLKLFVFVVILITASGIIYFGMVNKNSERMTARQKMIKAIYPVFVGFKRIFSSDPKINTNISLLRPIRSLYSLKTPAPHGQDIKFEQFRGKKILLVNTASDCGYTPQYDDLQKLYESYRDKLIIIGFPANDFKEQEKGTDDEIALFCKVNYGVSFPLAEKSSVVNGPRQNKIFEWLTHKNENGWTDQQPVWNFSKYLVNENGILTHYFDPSVSPLSKDVIHAILQ